MMASPYEPIRNDQDVEEKAALAAAKKRVTAGQPQQQQYNALETVPEAEDSNMMTKESGRYDGSSDTEVDLGGPGSGHEESDESASLFGPLKLKNYAARGGWGSNPVLSNTRRLVFNVPVVITLSLFFNFLLILILGVLAWKMSPPRTVHPPDELVYSKFFYDDCGDLGLEWLLT